MRLASAYSFLTRRGLCTRSALTTSKCPHTRKSSLIVWLMRWSWNSEVSVIICYYFHPSVMLYLYVFLYILLCCEDLFICMFVLYVVHVFGLTYLYTTVSHIHTYTYLHIPTHTALQPPPRRSRRQAHLAHRRVRSGRCLLSTCAQVCGVTH